MSRTRIALADDHAILREGLRSIINSQPDMEVVAEAGSGFEAIERVRETTPRVLCLDVSMPGGGSAATIENVHAASETTRVLMLTMHDDISYVRAALTAGADGYVLKSSPLPTLLAAIRSVAAGQRAIDPKLQPLIKSASDPTDSHDAPRLSRRENEILALLAEGHTHQEIASRLFVSIKSVETYRARIREKTGLKTRADFVRYGLEVGLLKSPGEQPRGDRAEREEG